jgi:hypothetical protein
MLAAAAAGDVHAAPTTCCAIFTIKNAQVSRVTVPIMTDVALIAACSLSSSSELGLLLTRLLLPGGATSAQVSLAQAAPPPPLPPPLPPPPRRCRQDG